jgi:hypothetical protein
LDLSNDELQNEPSQTPVKKDVDENTSNDNNLTSTDTNNPVTPTGDTLTGVSRHQHHLMILIFH